VLCTLMEVTTMTIKKSALSSKKTKNAAGKRLGKLTAPKGEKVSSMKGSDFTITKVIDKASPN
jgi:type VI protein secretion system component Hcp